MLTFIAAAWTRTALARLAGAGQNAEAATWRVAKEACILGEVKGERVRLSESDVVSVSVRASAIG